MDRIYLVREYGVHCDYGTKQGTDWVTGKQAEITDYNNVLRARLVTTGEIYAFNNSEHALAFAALMAERVNAKNYEDWSERRDNFFAEIKYKNYETLCSTGVKKMLKNTKFPPRTKGLLLELVIEAYSVTPQEVG